ncbi:hypothetical protein N2152v2_010779 [Parachlorella kessleri]
MDRPIESSHDADSRPRQLKRVLLVVDMQRDFLPGGAVAVPEADGLVPIINQLMRDERFDACLATKDHHPPDHISFAPRHEDGQVGDVRPTPSKKHSVQLFNSHCVAGTPGADFAEGLETSHIQQTFLKGMDKDREAFSGFYDMGRKHSTGLTEYLRAHSTEEVFVVGVALDYCVKATVADSLHEGFKTYVIVDGAKAVDAEEGRHALEELEEKGAVLVSATDLAGAADEKGS